MSISLSSKFLSVLVHDLKNPLNVIGLTVRLLEAEASAQGPDFENDLAVVRSNTAQINAILVQLNEFARLFDERIVGTVQEAVALFDPRRLLADLVEFSAESQGQGPNVPSPVLEILESCPREVELDQIRARLAIGNALLNAQSAAGGEPVRIRSSGTGDRWVIEVIAPARPPASLRSMDLSDGEFERLKGSPDDRRALDSAIVARISRLFGGSARLEVGEADTALVLDWPARHR